jgi:phosphoribosylformylglycinamidine synthase PurS subunit
MPTVRVSVTLKPSLLDSAGRTVAGSLKQDARIGKLIQLEVDTVDEVRIREMCQKLLANPVIEDYSFEVIG